MGIYHWVFNTVDLTESRQAVFRAFDVSGHRILLSGRAEKKKGRQLGGGKKLGCSAVEAVSNAGFCARRGSKA